MRHHLVVLREPYLGLILAGKKRIECRLGAVRRPPFESVAPGDLLWLKVPSGPIRAMAIAGKCLFRELGGGDELANLTRQYRDLICAEAAFYQDAAAWARFASLIWIDAVMAIGPMAVIKSDQRAWVVLDGLPVPGMRIGAAERPAVRAAGVVRTQLPVSGR